MKDMYSCPIGSSIQIENNASGAACCVGLRRVWRCVCVALAAVLVLSAVPLWAAAQQEPGISAKAAAVMVVGSGELLYGKNEHTRRPMASTTKIMTSLLAVEEKTPDREIEATDAMVRVEGTSMGLKAGDKITLSALVYGMLMKSGNDAANCVAAALGGNAEGFAKKMNARARQLGMENTNFVTPSGLDDPNHYSTAYDMALLGCAAIQNSDFANVCGKLTARVSFGDPPAARTLTSHNRMLKSYEGAVGIKTGFTKKSGRCLVSAATRNGVTIVAVTLYDPNDWKDHKQLLDYGFSCIKQFELDDDVSNIRLPVVGGMQQSVAVQCGVKPQWEAQQQPKEVVREIRMRHFEYAPLSAGKIVGEVRYTANGKLLCSVPLIVAQAVEQKKPSTPPDIKKQDKPGLLQRWFGRNG